VLVDYLTTFTRESFERQDDTLGSMDIDVRTLRTDECGRVKVPVWQLHALRR